MVGAAGQAIIFVSATVAQLIVTVYFLAYAAHAFLVVFEETAAGNQEVAWSRDPVFDWLWKLFYLGGMFLVSLVAAAVLLLFLLPLLLRWLPPLGFALLLPALTNLLFPFFLLSSLASDSLFQIVRTQIVGGLLRHIISLLIVFVVTTALAAGWGALAYLTFVADRSVLLPVMAVVGPAVLLIHARLLGRLAWLVSHHEPDRPKRKKKKHAVKGSKTYDPWAIPEPSEEPATEEEDRETGRQGDKETEEEKEAEVESYGLKEEELPPRSAPIPLDGEEPIGLAPEPPAATAPGEEKEKWGPSEAVAEKTFKKRLAQPREPIPPPAHPLLDGVYTIPLQAGLLVPWVYLTLGVLVMGMLLRLQISTWPG
jgi:hypothetical protein